MKAIYLAWGAILAEVGLFLGPYVLTTDTLTFVSVLLAHACACAVVALSTYLLLPARFQRPRLAVWSLMFVFAFIAPVMGALGMLLTVRTVLRSADDLLGHATPVAVDLPAYDVQSQGGKRSGQGSIRSRLGENVPAGIRMQSLLTLQAVPNRVANPILEDLLGDSTDDVRLIAFGMLDSEEKKLSAHIQRERANLAFELSAEQRYICLRHLAELHWELIYASLAQGEVRKHMLGEARSYLDQALSVGLEPESGLMFLKGRILLAQGETDASQAAIEQSLALGQPLTSALPYLAEIAFKRREFALVKQMMKQLTELNVASKTRAIVDFWCERDSVSKFSDRRYLPHI